MKKIIINCKLKKITCKIWELIVNYLNNCKLKRINCKMWDLSCKVTKEKRVINKINKKIKLINLNKRDKNWFNK